MKKSCMVVGIVMILGGSISAWAGSSPMVDHRLFIPGEDAMKNTNMANTQAVSNQALQKEFSLTGIVITPKEKKAIIKENIKSPEPSKNHYYHEGDQIKDMKIKEIQHNYIILASKENTVKLSLYRGDKVRPVAMPAAQEPPAPKAPQPGNIAQNKSNPAAANAPSAAPQTPSSPFGPGPAPNQPTAPTAGPSPSSAPSSDAQASPNPFAEAMQKAAAARAAQGSAPTPATGFVNPFATPGN